MKRTGLLLLLTAVSWSTHLAQAGVITLTGGDAGEGLTLTPSLVFAAENINGATANLQGVTFPMNGAAISYSSSSAYPGGFPTPGSPTANDTAITSLLGSSAVVNGGVDLVVTISGLSPSQSYIVNLLMTDHAAGLYERDLRFSYNSGAYINAFRTDTFGANDTAGYNVQETIVANGSGVITIGIDSPGYYSPASSNTLILGEFPVLSTVIVSAVPEPSSLSMIVCGACLLLVRGRRVTG